ncbi:MAG: hypothetical protein DRP01_01630 [Archaeoglobales archaeon]|nr:MAG: hypothetical protein DRP01_01630 [Archaeoglobales archaeon]
MRGNREAILTEVDNAIRLFGAQGVKPTLRTLFYYLVSKNIIPNTRSAYKRLSRILVKARKEGRYAWDFLEDKTRVVLGYRSDHRFSDDVLEDFEERLKYKLESIDISEILSELFDWMMPTIDVEMWAEQPIIPEIWIEKEALSSTIYNWTRDLKVRIRVNRGYSSWTFIYNNVEDLKTTLLRHDKVVILYLGDLDPSGVDIQRFLEEALEYFGLDREKVELRRVAVTPEQVEEFDLPPRPEDAETLAKLQRDTRSKSYTYDYIVELDSLVAYVPEEFRNIVRSAIYDCWDKDIYNKLKDRAKELSNKAFKLLVDYKEKAREKILNMLREE